MSDDVPQNFNHLNVYRDGKVLYVEIDNPPINLITVPLLFDFINLTKWVEDDSEIWGKVRSQIAKGKQAYVVCPLIGENETTQNFTPSPLTLRVAVIRSVSGFDIVEFGLSLLIPYLSHSKRK